MQITGTTSLTLGSRNVEFMEFPLDKQKHIESLYAHLQSVIPAWVIYVSFRNMAFNNDEGKNVICSVNVDVIYRRVCIDLQHTFFDNNDTSSQLKDLVHELCHAYAQILISSFDNCIELLDLTIAQKDNYQKMRKLLIGAANEQFAVDMSHCIINLMSV